jgi:DNA-directed RNA polymerase subunit RPC12/RpoP
VSETDRGRDRGVSGVIRIFWFALLAAIAASFISGGNETVIAIAFFGVIGFLIFALATDRMKLKCPYCGKRVKIGASHCHHCGRQAAAPRPLSFSAQQTSPSDVQRECPHCRTAMRPDASVCGTCRRDVDPWWLADGTWWMRESGGLYRLSLSTHQWEWQTSSALPPDEEIREKLAPSR